MCAVSFDQDGCSQSADEFRACREHAAVEFLLAVMSSGMPVVRDNR
jgi:hypothetical protein